MSKWHQIFKLGRRERERLYINILERDKGICIICKKDCEELLWFMHHLTQRELEIECKIHHLTLARVNSAFKAKNGRLWDIDHIQPLSENGGLNKNNLRTLCVKCHFYISKISYFKLHGRELPNDVIEWQKQYE